MCSVILFVIKEKKFILSCGSPSGRNCHIKSKEIDERQSVWRVGRKQFIQGMTKRKNY